jgi:4-amino-4-deoxy-L-arabinose transferase-like glycosyltransferase
VLSTAILIGAFLAFVLPWGLPFVISPLSTDEAYYALGGRVVLEGGELYTDFWDIKPPLVYLLYVIPLVLLGDNTEALRVFQLTFSVMAVAAVYLLTLRFFSRRAAIIAAGIYGFAYFALADFVALGEAESFMVVPLALAFAVYRPHDGERGAWVAAFAAGVLLGSAIALKFSAALLVLGLPAAELLFRQEGRWSIAGAVKRLTLAAVGFAIVQVFWVAYLVLDGTWSAFIDIQVNYTIPYNRFRWAFNEPYLRAMLRSTAEWLSSAAYITIPAWLALVLGLGRRSRPAIWLLSLLTGLAVVGVWWQGKLFHYHWLPLLPLMAPLAGYACDTLLDLVQPLGRRIQYQAAALLLAAFAVLGFGELLHRYDGADIFYDRVAGNITAAQAEDRFGTHNALVREMVDQIRVKSRPGDTYLVWGLWTLPYLDLNRPFPTRFIANHGLRALWAPEKWRAEFIDDMYRTRPRFIAVAAGDNMPWLTGADEASDQYICFIFPEFRQFIEDVYRAVLNNGLFVLYDREASEHTALPRCV